MNTPAPPRSRPPLIPTPPGAPNQASEMIQNRLRTFSRFLILGNDSGYQDIYERSMGAMRSVICDNYSNQWAYLPDANMYVPPMTDCKVIILRGIRDVRARWQTPNGLTVPNVTPTGAGCYLYFTEEELPPNPGKDISRWLTV